MQIVKSSLRWLRRAARTLGPYLMLELLLPGGTLFALPLVPVPACQPASAKPGPLGIPYVRNEIPLSGLSR